MITLSLSTSRPGLPCLVPDGRCFPVAGSWPASEPAWALRGDTSSSWIARSPSSEPMCSLPAPILMRPTCPVSSETAWASWAWGLTRVKGKSILLKPNLVEPSQESPHINTHPKLVRAVVEVFRSWDAREVFVAEGQGHCRDSDFVLEQSGLGPNWTRKESSISI